MSHDFDRRRFLNLSLAGGVGLWVDRLAHAAPGSAQAPSPRKKAATGATATAAIPPSGELAVGAATISITPDKPVPLMGQMHLRVGKTVESPVTAQALALESRRSGQVIDQAIFVSCDLAVLRGGILEKVRERAKGRLPGFDLSKLVLNATHTHSAPIVAASSAHSYDIPKDVMQPAEYLEFLVDRLTEVIAKAWQARRPGLVGWGLGHAVVAQNRRAVYADGHAQMYGKTNQPDFRGLEGYEDHGVEVLYFWDRKEKLVATAVNVACPAQELESNLAVSADYWDKVRKLLRARHGEGLVVLGWIGAAGDQSPHLLYRKEAEERMRRLRGLSRVEEIARRIDRAWVDAYEAACKDKHANVVLGHKVATIDLPARRVTAREYAQAKQEVARLSKNPRDKGRMQWNQNVVDRYAQQEAAGLKPYPMELHVVRLGDVAVATNDFELYTDFATRIKARSPATQTFIVQLAGGGTYLPPERAVRGGGYGAIPQSNRVGPEGGQVLVERTLQAIQDLWKK